VPNPLELAMANPWTTLRAAHGGPLHPGGADSTEELLDRADVTEGTRLLDVGCGAGEAVSLARQRDARAVGLDVEPTGAGTVRGDMTRLPLREASVDVVLAECVMCLASERSRAVREARRVLKPDGRLALSDVVVDGALPDLPEPIARALCLRDARSREETVASLEREGLAVRGVRDHREDLLAMRDRIAGRVDFEAILGRLGDRGRRLLDGIDELETAVETGRVGYVSVVATCGASDRD